MTATATLLERNQAFAKSYDQDGLTPLPKFRSVILTCGDARVDPAHVLGLELGDSVVIRNNGGRATKSAREEIAALATMVAMMDGEGGPGPFELILMQHTQCGAQRFADPGFQELLKSKIGIDVSESAITDHETDLKADIERLRDDKSVPDHVVVSAYIYDMESGLAQEVSPPQRLR